MKKILALISLFSLQAITFAQTKLSATEISSFQKKVTSESKALQSLTADFTQTKHISFLSKPITSTGKLYLKSDEKLKWEYLSPTKYAVVFKDKKLFVNNQGKKSTVDLATNKQFEKLSKLISGTISGSMFDDQEFTISYFKNNNEIIVNLKPKAKDLAKYVKEIELYFDKNGQLVEQTKMIEPNNDYTLIKFTNKKINASVNDSVFTL
nr:outer membrane lipoprotein carrier protein LolA [uncultured Flavobacterium sp.]